MHGTMASMRRIFGVVVGCALLGACGDRAEPPTQSAAVSAPVTRLESTDLVVGTGAPIEPGQVAVVHYTGWLYDPLEEDFKGREFDSSRHRGMPFRFEVGAGRVIRGWDQGVVGMQTGGQRRLVIPPDLGYGRRGSGPIPANATLVFDIELLAIE